MTGDDIFNIALGRRLRAARRHKALSLTEVETLSAGEFKASVLGAYERGERALSVQRLARLSALYGIPAHQLVPAGEAEEPEGGEVIDLDRVAAGEDTGIVDRFLASIHLMRRAEPTDLAVRRSDMAILATMLGDSETPQKDPR